jgi:hypothetical protein
MSLSINTPSANVANFNGATVPIDIKPPVSTFSADSMTVVKKAGSTDQQTSSVGAPAIAGVPAPLVALLRTVGLIDKQGNAKKTVHALVYGASAAGMLGGVILLGLGFTSVGVAAIAAPVIGLPIFLASTFLLTGSFLLNHPSFTAHANASIK